MKRKHVQYWQSIHGQRQAKDFLKRSSAKRAGRLFNLRRNHLQIMLGLLRGHCHLSGHLFKLGLADNSGKQASEMVLQVLYDCEALATLRFRHLARHFMKPGDLEEISVSRILQDVQGAGLLNARIQGLHKVSRTVKVHGSLLCMSFLYSILFYTVHSQKLVYFVKYSVYLRIFQIKVADLRGSTFHAFCSF
jgi:hypothetical protein